MKNRLLPNQLPSIHFNGSFPPRFLGVASACTLLVSGVASAATQYWDPGLTPTANGGKGSGGDGTWATATANWSDGALDAVLVSVAPFNVAGFAGSSGTIGLTTAVSAAGLLFETNNYVLGNATGLSQAIVASQVTDTSGIVAASGVTGTVIDVGSIRLGSSGSSVSVWLANTDLIDFKTTTLYLSGSRTTKVTNSSASATTTIAKFGTSDKTAGGTWPNAQVHLLQGNLTINSLAAGASLTNGTLGTFGGNATTVSFPTIFAGASTGTLTINGNNTLYTNAIAGQGPVIFAFNMANGTLDLGHDNALGARTAGNVLTNNTLEMRSGNVLSSSGPRNIENKLTIAGNCSIGGSNDFTFTQDVTTAGGSRTLTVNNSATTISGSVYLANDDNTARTFTISGDSNTTISGAIANNKFGGSLASNLTKSGNGILTVSNANSYSGTTTITAGTLKIGNTQSLGHNGLTKTAETGGTTVSFGGTLDLNGQTGVDEVLSLSGNGDGVNVALVNHNATLASLAGGVVSSLSLTGTAAGLSVPPTVTISGGGGSGATAVASLGLTAASIETPVVTGTYTTAPVVTISGGGGSGATATVTTAGVLTLTNAGSGYTSAPTVTFAGGVPASGVSMTATANATNFALVGIALTANGSGYTSAPTVSLSTDPDTAATANLSSVELAGDTSVGGTGDIVVNAPVSGDFALTKVGVNTVTLAAANTYTGPTSVDAGKVNITGSIASAVTVNATGALSGTGSVTGNVQVTSGGHFASAIATTPGTHVPLAITGTLTVNAGNILDLTAAAAPAAGIYKLATTTGGVTYTAGTVNLTGVAGTVSVSGNDLILTVVGGGSAYSTWASSKGLTGSNNGAIQDPDFDGIANEIEFIVGGNPLASDTGKLPLLTTDATHFIFTFKRADESEAEIALTFQWGSALTGWTSVAIGATTGTSGAGVTVTEDSPSATVDTVEVKIPKTSAVDAKLFGRLKCVK